MKTVDVEQLSKELEGNEPPTLVDVRSGMEFASGHVAAAVHMPLGSIGARASELQGKGPIYLICRSGARSAQAAQLLAGKGLEVVNVQGGTSAWQASGYPVEADKSLARLVMPLAASLTLGLAPFFPEPHIVGKLRWLAGGAVGMGLGDYLDVLMHGAPWVWLLTSVVAYLRTPSE